MSLYGAFLEFPRLDTRLRKAPRLVVFIVTRRPLGREHSCGREGNIRWEDAGLAFGKQALTSVVDLAGGQVFSGAMAAASSAPGVGGVIGKTMVSGVQTVTTSTINSAINAVQWTGDGLGWSEDAFNAGMQGGLISAATGMTSTFTSGMMGQMNLFDGNNLALSNAVFDTGSIQRFNAMAGNLAAQGVNYALTGDFSLNLLNMADLSGGRLQGGLLELHLGEDGATMNIGMGGADMSLGTIAASMSGLVDTLKIGTAKAAALAGMREGVATLNGVNMLGYTGNGFDEGLGRSIWGGKVKVEYGDTGGEFGHYDDNDPNKITLSEKLLDAGLEEAAKLATVMAHEGTHAAGNRYEWVAHEQGLATYSALLQNLGLQGDMEFGMGMVAALLAPESYTENTGAVQQWKLMEDGSLVYDREGWLKNEDGKYINIDGTLSSKPIPGKTIGAAGVETGLLNILNGQTSNLAYSSYSEQQITAAQQLMEASGMMHTVNPEDPTNRSDWMWDRTGSYIDSVGGEKLTLQLDAGAYNDGLALGTELLFSDFGSAYDSLLYNALPPEDAYNVLTKNNRNTFGLVNLPRDDYTGEQQAEAEAFRQIANQNAALPNVQPGYPDANGQTHYDNGLPVTWCNRKMYYDTDDTLGSGNYDSMLNPEGIGYTRANHLGFNLAANYPELDPVTAQKFANMGLQVRAAWIHPEAYEIGPTDALSGHVASVVANYGVYDPRRGPRISQAGISNGEMWSVQGFGKTKFPQVKYYWVMPDDLLKSLQYDNWWR